MDSLQRDFIFGDDIDIPELAGLDLSLLPNLSGLLDDKPKVPEKKAAKSTAHNSSEAAHSFAEPENTKIIFDEEIVTPICIDESEKIYKLTELNIPADSYSVRRVENYLRKLINKVKKDKNEKEEEAKKREANERNDIQGLMKRMKHNQKYARINVSYDEKFFDSTKFLEKGTKINKFKDRKDTDKRIKDQIILKQTAGIENNSIEITDKNYRDILINNLCTFNESYKSKKNIVLGNKLDEDFERRETENNLINNFFSTLYANKFESDKISEDLFLDQKLFYNFISKKSSIIKSIENTTNNNQNDTSDELIKITPTQEHCDNYDLQDFIKRKRNRSIGYVNPKLSTNIIKNSVIITPKFTDYYTTSSMLYYDLNDYNMNFEVLEEEETQPTLEENKPGNLQNYLANGDFFTNFPKPQNHNVGLKIGNSKGTFVTHAKCAYSFEYNSLHLSNDELIDFHRPNFSKHLLKEKTKRCMSIKFFLEESDKNNNMSNARYPVLLKTKSKLQRTEDKLKSKNIQYMNAYEVFKHSKKLSLTEGKYVLFEHIDEHPLFLENFGMSNKMRKYLFTPKIFISNQNKETSNFFELIKSSKFNETEVKTLKMIGPYGAQQILKPEQKLPLLGQLNPADFKGINVLDNNMYRAPIFYENVSMPKSAANFSSDKKKRHNFLLTFTKKNDKKIFSLREIDDMYTVAQEEPKIEVYPPQSRQYNNFLKNKIETFTYKIYNEVGYNVGIPFKHFQLMFPTVTEQVLKKIFKDMNIEIDKNLCYFKKFPGEIEKNKITPENICQFESTQYGIHTLNEVGIKNITSSDKISYATNKFSNQPTTTENESYYAKIIEESLLTTPWNITTSYLQAKQTKGMLSIKGIGDPSNGNGGYSFLKLPVKSYNENKTLKEEMDVMKNQNKNVKIVTGTDADLRKLSKEEIKMKLRQLGFEEDKIDKMGRWKRVHYLRAASSQAVEMGYKGDIVKYARNQRYNIKSQREEYQKKINEVFKKQINYIINADEIPLNEAK